MFSTQRIHKLFWLVVLGFPLAGTPACPRPGAYGSLVASRGSSAVVERLEDAVRKRHVEDLLRLFSRDCLRHSPGFRFRRAARAGTLQLLRWERRDAAGTLADDLWGQLRMFKEVARARVRIVSLQLTGARSARAELSLAVDGRLPDGSRRTDRGVWRLALARRADGRWQIDGFGEPHMTTVVSRAPLLERQRAASGRPAPGAAAPRSLSAPGADRGAGLAVADVDGDGDLDVFLPGVGLGRLWRNDGKGGLRGDPDPVAPGGANAPLGERAVFGDVDADGDPDLFVTTVRGHSRLLENRSGRLVVSKRPGLQGLGPATAAAWIDADADGRLDLILAPGRPGQGKPLTLLHNEGARFRARPDALPRDPDGGAGGDTAALCAGDLDGDGRVDLVHVPALGRVRVLRNQPGTRTFTATGALDAEGLGRDCSIADLDGDGDLDVAVAGVHSAEGWKYAQAGFPGPGFSLRRDPAGLRSRLHRLVRGSLWLRNDGDLQFTRRAAGTPASRGWDVAVAAEDLDGDGRAELLLAGGFFPGASTSTSTSPSTPTSRAGTSRTGQGQPTHQDDLYFTGWLPRHLRNQTPPRLRPAGGALGATRGATLLVRRQGALRDVGWAAGLALPPGIRAVAIADLDRDGHPDLLLRDRAGALIRYRWRAPLGKGRVLTLRLSGRRAPVTGATARAEGLDERALSLLGGGASGRPWAELRLGLGSAARADRVRLRWPDGTRQTLQDLDTRAGYTVARGRSEPTRGLGGAAATDDPATPARRADDPGEAPPPRPARPATIAGVPLDTLGDWQVASLGPPAPRQRRGAPAGDGTLSSRYGKKGTVIYLPPAGCLRKGTACRTYLSTLAKAARQWRARGIAVIAVLPRSSRRALRRPSGRALRGLRAVHVVSPGYPATAVGRLLVLGPPDRPPVLYLDKRPAPLVLWHHLAPRP